MQSTNNMRARTNRYSAHQSHYESLNRSSCHAKSLMARHFSGSLRGTAILVDIHRYNTPEEVTSCTSVSAVGFAIPAIS
jgi:hypothetical protein